MPRLLSPLIGLAAGILATPVLDTRAVWTGLVPALGLATWRPRYALLFTFLLGATLGSYHTAEVPRLSDDGYPVRLTAVVSSPPEFRAPGYYLDIQILRVEDAPVEGRARLSYFPPDDDPRLSEMFQNLDLGEGDRIAALVRLRRPGVYRNPGGFDYRQFLERRKIYWIGSIRNPRLIQVLDRGWHGPDRLRSQARRRIEDRLSGDATTRALALGMILGQRRRLPESAERQFEAAGLIHLLVVSGFNLAVVAAVVLWLGSRLPLGGYRRTGSRLFAVAGILAYAFLVEGDAPVIRATLMALFLIVGSLLDRGYRIGNALLAAAFLILLANPWSLLESSFQLTFAAVAAILLIAIPGIQCTTHTRRLAIRRLHRTSLDRTLPIKATDWRVWTRLRAEVSGRPLWTFTLGPWIGLLLVETVIVTVAIQLTLLPWSVESFHRLSPVAIPLNVVGAAVAALVTPLGLVLLIVPDWSAAPIAWLIDAALKFLVIVVDAALRWPGATFRVPSPPTLIWALFAVVLTAIIWTIQRRLSKGIVVAGLGMVALLVVITIVDFSPAAPAYPRLTFLDVGQGDAILIELPDGQRLMVDGGGVASGAFRSLEGEGGFRIGEDVLTPYLLSRGIRHLDALVLTHAHHDHVDGLLDLVRNFSVGELWTGPNSWVPSYQELLEEASLRGVPHRWLFSGDRVGPFSVLNPPRGHRVGFSVANDDSLVLLLDSGNSSVLLTGDLESDLIEAPPRVTVLKVPHHGSRNTRLHTKGDLPVISVGATNTFGHPHPSRLPALRTDLLGAIEVGLTPGRPSVSFPGLR